MTSRPLPESCAIAFKEWAGVCDALADGRQCVILRKGGIAEGPRGFTPEHEAFWLYPTSVHQGEQGLRGVPTSPVAGTPDWVDLKALAVVESLGQIDRPEALGRLAEFHVWTGEPSATCPRAERCRIASSGKVMVADSPRGSIRRDRRESSQVRPSSTSMIRPRRTKPALQ